jgi:hypothetical protein
MQHGFGISDRGDSDSDLHRQQREGVGGGQGTDGEVQVHHHCVPRAISDDVDRDSHSRGSSQGAPEGSEHRRGSQGSVRCPQCAPQVIFR